MNIYLCFLVVCTSPFAVTTTVGVLDLRRVSISSEFKSFLLSLCIETPESITNSLSSANFEVGASVALALIGEQNVALSAFLNL